MGHSGGFPDPTFMIFRKMYPYTATVSLLTPLSVHYRFLVLRGGSRSVKETVDHKKYEYKGQDQDGFLKRPRGDD